MTIRISRNIWKSYRTACAIWFNIKKKQKLYHVCFETDDLEDSLHQMEDAGAMTISQPKPAPLFDGRRVAFVVTGVGMVELLETQRKCEAEK